MTNCNSEITLLLGFQPLSSNKRLIASRGRLIASSEYREFKQRVQEALSATHENDLIYLDMAYRNQPLCCQIYIAGNWLTKDKTLKRKDVQNLEKALLDSVFELLPHLDDSQICHLSITKVQSTDDWTSISLSPEKLLYFNQDKT